MSHVPGAVTCPVTSTFDGLSTFLPEVSPAGEVSFRFDASHGLYQFSVLMDAREFDWEQLYEVLDKYHNVNERTGPWDFSINFGATPLVPSYWVSVNGERRGLWFFARVSLEDLEHKRFRGRVAFYAAGPTTVTLTPFQPATLVPGQKPYDWRGLRWAAATLEPDPEDHLAELPFGLADGTAAPAAAWAREEFWAAARQKLATTHAAYAQPLRRSFDWVLGVPDSVAGSPPADSLGEARSPEGNDLLLLLAAWKLGERAEAREALWQLIDRLVALPAWGNPNPEGYSHNGDMGPARNLRGLAWMLWAVGEEMGEERRARVQEKLRLQGQIFFNLVLVNRDYWGGSVTQDHGWKSLFDFGIAALTLRGVLPEAELWTRYALPRIARGLAAMPTDGVVPLSSHQAQYLYLDDLTHYRDTLLAVGGDDIFAGPQFRPVVKYLATTLDEARRVILYSGYDRSPFSGANHFLNHMASLHGDREAAYLQARLLESSKDTFYHATEMYADYLGAVYGFLTYDPGVTPVAALSPARLTHFADNGTVHYRDDAAGVALSVHCGPYAGYNSYRHTFGPCDRLGGVPGEGHFSLYRDGLPLLCSPDGGYSLRSATRSVLLIDGEGQYGDIGYPMSIPSLRDRGAQVVSVAWNEARGTGLVRLWLQPAYQEAQGVASYYRDFLLAPGQLTVRDSVVLDEPRRLSWLFQGKDEYGVALDGLTARFGDERGFTLEPVTPELDLAASLAPTHIVWSYASSSGFKPFAHVRYDATAPMAAAVVDFVFRWL